jgi:hypothetical protein
VSSYQDRLKTHLAAYKEQVLGITSSGTWHRNGKETEVKHILPIDVAKQNLLPHYREECWKYMESPANGIKKHLYFHHLNSSRDVPEPIFSACSWAAKAHASSAWGSGLASAPGNADVRKGFRRK